MRRLFAKIFLSGLNLVLYACWPKLVIWHYREIKSLPRLANPIDLNDKVQWRKVFDRNPAFPDLLDKLKVREIAKQRCPEIALPEIYWTGDNADDIPFDDLPLPVILKTNDGSGRNHFLYDLETADREAIKAKFRRWLSEEFGPSRHEWGYTGIPPTIFAEKILSGTSKYLPADFKVFVHDGKTSYVDVCCGRRTPEKTHTFFDPNFNFLPVRMMPEPNNPAFQETPLHYVAMQYAEQIAGDLDHIRVDLYVHDDQIFFGEITLYHDSGRCLFEPPSYAVNLGADWDILNAHYFRQPQTPFRRIYRAAILALR